MKIYTRTGDTGKTSLINNTRVWKDDIRISAYGSVDELNCFLGIAIAQITPPKKTYQKYLFNLLTNIQKDLFSIGSSLADPDSRVLDIDLNKKTKSFEKEIDYMTKQLSPLSNFILPGGGKLGAFLHVARAVSRRAEREVVRLSKEEKVDENLLIYINRLSDLLFTMARYANNKEGIKEQIWQK